MTPYQAALLKALTSLANTKKRVADARQAYGAEHGTIDGSAYEPNGFTVRTLNDVDRVLRSAAIEEALEPPEFQHL